MSYEIKEEGYEHRGFKLGQMTNRGKIIGFVECNSEHFVITNQNYKKLPLCESVYVDIILKGYENSNFNWFYEDMVLAFKDNNPEETQLNAIQQIRNAINCATVKVEFFSEEFCVSLYDSEIPICWDKQNGLYILTETMSGNIDHEMMVEILSVMDIIKDNLNWFTEILRLKGE